MSDRTDLIEQIQADEADFEKIRLTLINELAEPARTAFWMAVTGRDRAREAIAALRAGAGDAVDAARYRWLREQHWSDGVIAVVPNPKTAVKLGHDCPSLDRLDEIIDASRSALSQPAQSRNDDRKTFSIPPGHEAVLDSEGRATGEVRPISRSDVSEAVTQAATANMPAEFQGEIGAGDLDRMVRAIIAAHDSIWERRANAMAEHHRQAVVALKDGGRTNG